MEDTRLSALLSLKLSALHHVFAGQRIYVRGILYSERLDELVHRRRDARHENGRVILYADNMTGSLKTAIETCSARRAAQAAYNESYNITPKSVTRPIESPLIKRGEKLENVERKSKGEIAEIVEELRREMLACADRLDFERAAVLRDQIKYIRDKCAK